MNGSSQPNSQKGYLPREVGVTKGTNNRVIWTNNDSISQSVVSDTSYVDKLTGKAFDFGLIPPGGRFEFVFTEPGEYRYHAEPHLWMTGTVTVVEAFG